MDNNKTAKIQLFSCVIFYIACQTHGIMVKFGTKQGPIEPEVQMAHSEIPKVRVYRNPAPVWEPRADDVPDPNANWRPQSIMAHPIMPQSNIRQPLYTKTVYNNGENKPLEPTNAKDFVNSYKKPTPLKPYIPVPGDTVANYFTPQQIVAQLGAQNVPGVGLRYFVPIYVQIVKTPPQIEDEDKLIELETNEIDTYSRIPNKNHHSRRSKTPTRSTQYNENGRVQYVYQFPAFVPPNRHV